MMIVQFEQHVHIRLGEWLAAAISLSIGILLFAVPDMFKNEQLFEAMRQFARQQVWAFALFSFGLARIIALYVNGRKGITPYVRMAMAFFSCFIWYNFTLGLFLSGVPALSLVTIPWLLVLDIYNVFRASADARDVFDRKRAKDGREELS